MSDILLCILNDVILVALRVANKKARRTLFIKYIAGGNDANADIILLQMARNCKFVADAIKKTVISQHVKTYNAYVDALENSVPFQREAEFLMCTSCAPITRELNIAVRNYKYNWTAALDPTRHRHKLVRTEKTVDGAKLPAFPSYSARQVTQLASSFSLHCMTENTGCVSC